MRYAHPAVLLFVLAALGGALAPASAQPTRTVTRSATLAPDGHVEMDTFTGSVRITGWDRDRVEMEARIEGDDQDLVDKTALRIEAEPRRFAVEVDYDEVKDSQKFLGLIKIGNIDQPAVHITLKMPRTAGLTLDDFSSEVTVEGLRSGASLETFSSTIVLRDIDGPLNLETFSGEIEGEDLRGRVQLETFSGDVRLRMAVLTGNSRFETFSGDVELTLPAEAAFELVGEDDAFGELDSAFALRSDDGRRVAGEGGPRIELDTFSGDFRLRKP